jgi:hypothetical protein
MKTILKGVVLVAFTAILCTVCIAQDNSAAAKPKSGGAAQQPSMPPMPKPDPQMTKLIKMMSGTWTVTEKAEPGPMFPKGGTGKGTARLWAGPGGMSLMEMYHSNGVMGAFNGAGTFWWDPKAQVYHGLWCDNMTPGGCDASGTTKWEGDSLVGMMEGEMNGQKMMTKFTYSDFKPNSFVMTMASGPDANSLKPMMTVTYTKAAMAAKSEKPAQ